MGNKIMLKESDINIAVISNFTVEPILGKNLNSIFSRAMCKVNLQSISYDEYSTEENLNIIHYSDRIIVWLNIDCFYPDLINDLISKKVSTEEIVNDAKIKFLNLYSTLRHNSQVPILWMGVEDYCYYHYNHSFGNLLICEGVIDRVNFEVIFNS